MVDRRDLFPAVSVDNKKLSPEQRMTELDKIFEDPRMRRPWSSRRMPVGKSAVEDLSPEQRMVELDKIFSDPRIRRQP